MIRKLQIQDEIGQNFPSHGRPLVAFMPMRHQRAHPVENAQEGDSGWLIRQELLWVRYSSCLFSHMAFLVSKKG